MAVVTITNPRVSATADITIDTGFGLTVHVARDANEGEILEEIRLQIAAESERRLKAGEQPLPQVTVEDLVPALAIFHRLGNGPVNID